ncbi:hypothetical protein ANANG_G00209130 [Anguilla anguilla]|uniref:Uncharacterized protein n=1 Tax=Anguilla anguilla TaxID=7936 RepID=A0A9D3LZH5_ANGAN|nr:hypothetical protein ANANG_G00209130 [Anguilla anguilla]
MPLRRLYYQREGGHELQLVSGTAKPACPEKNRMSSKTTSVFIQSQYDKGPRGLHLLTAHKFTVGNPVEDFILKPPVVKNLTLCCVCCKMLQYVIVINNAVIVAYGHKLPVNK